MCDFLDCTIFDKENVRYDFSFCIECRQSTSLFMTHHHDVRTKMDLIDVHHDIKMMRSLKAHEAQRSS